MSEDDPDVDIMTREEPPACDHMAVDDPSDGGNDVISGMEWAWCGDQCDNVDQDRSLLLSAIQKHKRSAEHDLENSEMQLFASKVSHDQSWKHLSGSSCNCSYIRSSIVPAYHQSFSTQVVSRLVHGQVLQHLSSATYVGCRSFTPAHAPTEGLLCFAEKDMWAAHWWS